jgi:hypothetical protein
MPIRKTLKKVFISYRRDDAKWQARELYLKLTVVLPHDHVFMDIDTIPPGVNFVDVLEDWVKQCDILLALIGPGWSDAKDPSTGGRRFDNPNDFVRIEIRGALVREIPIVPVLLEGAPIPIEHDLPDDLKELVHRNAEYIVHRTVDTDVQRLIKKLGLARTSHRVEARHSRPVHSRPRQAEPVPARERTPVQGKIARKGDGTFRARYDEGVRLRRRTPHQEHAELQSANRDPVKILAAST